MADILLVDKIEPVKIWRQKAPPYDGPVISLTEAIAAGLGRYFSGRLCPQGHVSQRLVRTRTCIACTRASIDRCRKARALVAAVERQAEASRREEGRAAAKIVRENAKALRRADAKARGIEYQIARNAAIRAERKANPEPYRAVERAKRIKAGPDGRAEAAAIARDWRKLNSERHRASSKAYRQKKPDVHRAAVRTRRALKRGANGSHSASDIADIRRMQKDCCPICLTALRKKGHVDHIVPLAKGGSNDRKNIQVLCAPCNMRKHDKDPILFMRELGFLL